MKNNDESNDDMVPLAVVPRRLFQHVEEFAKAEGVAVGALVIRLVADAMKAKGEADQEHADEIRAYKEWRKQFPPGTTFRDEGNAILPVLPNEKPADAKARD